MEKVKFKPSSPKYKKFGNGCLSATYKILPICILLQVSQCVEMNSSRWIYLTQTYSRYAAVCLLCRKIYYLYQQIKEQRFTSEGTKMTFYFLVCKFQIALQWAITQWDPLIYPVISSTLELDWLSPFPPSSTDVTKQLQTFTTLKSAHLSCCFV